MSNLVHTRKLDFRSQHVFQSLPDQFLYEDKTGDDCLVIETRIDV